MKELTRRCAATIAALLLLAATAARAQEAQEPQPRRYALKTNGLYWLALTPNLGFEMTTGKKTSFDISAGYNPWTFKDNKCLHFWYVQPEYRYWLCECHEGHFFGLHAHGAQWYGSFNDKRRDGYLAGGGITYGYNWILSPHWNLEAAVGVGYAHLWWKEADREPCVKEWQKKNTDYWGVTKVALSVGYFF